MSRVFVIPDTHFPFHSKKLFKKVLPLIAERQPTHVVQIGDLLDQYVFAKWARSVGVTPKEDVEYGLLLANDMWKAIREVAPKAKYHQLLGNHDMRLAKRIAEKFPEMADFFSHKDLYKFDGVKVQESDREHIEIDGVVYVHGWLSKSLDHAKYFGKPTVHGHRHRPAIEFDRKDLWSMDVGYLADPESLPLQYTANRFSKWTAACGEVDNKEPRLFLL